MEEYNYPIVSVESRSIRDDTNYQVQAKVVNLRICKVVQLNCIRKTNQTINTSYTDVFTSIPNDLKPINMLISVTDNSDITAQLSSANGIRAKAKTSGSYNFTVTFTYVII